MDKLQARPKSFFSWNFNLFLDETLLTTVALSRFRTGGRFQYQGVDYEMQREGMLSGDFLLKKGEVILAQATKESAFRRTFAVLCGKHSYVLKPRSLWHRDFVLLENDVEVGRVSPIRFYSRSCIIDFPDELPLPVHFFLFWLVWVMWRRAHHSAAGGS